MRKSQAAKPIVLPVVPEARRFPDESQAQSASQPSKEPTEERFSADRAEPWKSLSETALRRLEKMLEIEPRILHDGDPVAIHDLRVASRRLQQALKLLYVPPPSRQIRGIVKCIRRSRAALSDLRNDDVLLDYVGAVLGRKRAARRAAWNAVAEYLTARRSRLLRKACRKLVRTNLGQTYWQLNEALGQEASRRDRETDESVRRQSASEFADGLNLVRERVWRNFTARVEAASANHSAGAMHRVRIAVKRLRYLMEILQDLGGVREDQPLVDLRRLQQILGEWHDRVVLEQAIVETITEGKLLRDNLALAMELERLMLHIRRAKEKLEGRFFDWARNPENMARLDAWVSRVGKPLLAGSPEESPQ